MADKDNVPDKIDLRDILEKEDSPDNEVEVLDPETGDPADLETPAEAAPPPAGGADIDFLQKGLAEMREEKERFEDLYVRTRADFENYRKRTERDREEEVTRSIGQTLREILPVIDNLERALEGAPADDPFVEGISIIHKQLCESLRKMGLEPIQAPPGEPFDPVFHEAVCTEESAEFESNRVLAQIQTGYLFRGRVLRPSMVKVSVAAAEEDSAPEAPAGNESPDNEGAPGDGPDHRN